MVGVNQFNWVCHRLLKTSAACPWHIIKAKGFPLLVSKKVCAAGKESVGMVHEEKEMEIKFKNS